MKKEGHTVKTLDFMFSKDPDRELDRALIKFKPDIAGISIRNLDNQKMLSPDNPLPEIRKYITYIRKNHPGIKIITGGMAFSTFPEEMFKYMEPDFGISGQGENSFPKLVRSIETGIPEKTIPGLVWNENGVIKMNPPLIKGFKNTGADWNALNLKNYRRSLWPASVTIKTGCIYQCSYCEGPGGNFGTKFIFRDTDVILNDIRRIIKLFGIRVFFFADPCFGSPLDKAKELLEGIIKSGLKIHFMVPFAPVRESYDGELFELYKKAGGLLPIMGCDTFSKKMLKSYNKPFNLDDIYDWAQTANRHGVKFSVELLFGGPGENEETVRESMAFIEKIPYSLFLYGIGIRILPETGLYHIARREGFFQKDEELLFPKFYVSKSLNVKWAEKYIETESAKYSRRMSSLLPVMIRNSLARYLNLVV